jgi:segregation and condensation protein B
VDFLQNHIEALIFCSPTPIKLGDIKACLSEMFNADVPDDDIEGAIYRLQEKFESDDFSFQLFQAAGGYQFLTKPAYQTSIGIMLKQQSKKRLSTSAMETLSIIAYKQPISKTDIENIRGVNCDYAVQKLLDRNLIEITGKADTIGRPMLYGTTVKFMEYFGINDLTELPAPKEFTGDVSSIGENAETKEEPTTSMIEEPEAALPENTDEAPAAESTTTDDQENTPDTDADNQDLKTPDAQA